MFGKCCVVFDNIMKHKTFKDRCTFGSELKVIVRRPNLVEESEEHRNSLIFELKSGGGVVRNSTWSYAGPVVYFSL